MCQIKSNQNISKKNYIFEKLDLLSTYSVWVSLLSTYPKTNMQEHIFSCNKLIVTHEFCCLLYTIGFL